MIMSLQGSIICAYPEYCTHQLQMPNTRHLLLTACAAATTYAGYKLSGYTQTYKALKWDWKTIDTQKIPTNFPQDFLWGASTSAYQVEGDCTNNNWYAWEQALDAQGNPRVQEPSGKACDHWNRYRQDIKELLADGMHANAFRFSIEWSKIEPQEGVFDESAIEHYHDVCKELIKHGIKPCINSTTILTPYGLRTRADLKKMKMSHTMCVMLLK